MIRKIAFTIACFMVLYTGTNAQELTFGLDGGWQGLSYKLPNGKNNLLGDGTLSLGFTFPLKSHWNFIAGLSGGFYGTRATLDNGTYTYNQADITGSAFQYKIATTNYQETQRFFSFGVPLLLQYHTTGLKTQWFINAGAHILLPFNANIKASAQQLSLSAYYPDFNAELSNLPQHGLGTVDNWQGSGTSKLKTATALVAESGLSFALSTHTRLYVGIFLEYGLSDLRANNPESPIVPYSPNGITDLQAGSVLNSPATDMVRALSYGLTVKLGLGHPRPKSRPHATPQETHQSGVPRQDTTRTVTAAPDTVRTEGPVPIKDTAGHALKKLTQDQASAPSPMSNSLRDSIQIPVTFGILGKTSLPDGQKPHLDQVADILKNHPDIHITITGHTCDIGTIEENIKVGEARARAVADYLQQKGVDAKRMEIRSSGKSNPMVPNTSSNNRSKNRRVTIIYLSVAPN
jgi:OOP family OmpA-OmpF porin